MKVTTERIPDSQVVLNIEVEPDVVERYMQLAYKHLVQRVNVPGFRRGKTPRAMLERYLGRDAFFDEAMEHLVPDVYRQAIVENDVAAIADPRVEIVQAEPLALKATVAIRPTVVLGDYQGIRVAQEAVAVTAEDVEAVVERLRSTKTEWVGVERPVAAGDRVLITVTATSEGQLQVDHEDWDYYVVAGSTVPLPGFSEALVGASSGEERSFTLSVPDEESRGSMRGKELAFIVVVKEAHEGRLPPLDDDFARGVDPECATLEDLRRRIRQDLEQRMQAEAKGRQADAILDAIVAGAEIEFPPVLLDREVERLCSEHQQALAERGIRWESFLANAQQTEDDFRRGIRPLAERRLKRGLVLYKVAEAEQITVGDEEVGAEAERIAASAGAGRAELHQALLASEGAREGIEDLLLRRKVTDRLLELCSVDGTEEVAPVEADVAATSSVSTD